MATLRESIASNGVHTPGDTAVRRVQSVTQQYINSIQSPGITQYLYIMIQLIIDNIQAIIEAVLEYYFDMQ